MATFQFSVHSQPHAPRGRCLKPLLTRCRLRFASSASCRAADSPSGAEVVQTTEKGDRAPSAH
jgi:hypothetical protein